MADNEAELMRKILSCYVQLSPENIWMDGEASHTEARNREIRIKVQLSDLFKELGRVVTEQEAYNSSKN